MVRRGLPRKRKSSRVGNDEQWRLELTVLANASSRVRHPRGLYITQKERADKPYSGPFETSAEGGRKGRGHEDSDCAEHTAGRLPGVELQASTKNWVNKTSYNSCGAPDGVGHRPVYERRGQ